MQKIIDTHVHIWDLKQLRLPWLDEVEQLNHDHLESDYIQAITSHDYQITQAIYIEVDADKHCVAKENAMIINACEQPQSIFSGACITGDLSQADFGQYIEHYNQYHCIKGVRQVLHVPEREPGFCLQPMFIDNVQRLGALNLVFEGCVRAEELHDLYQLACACPNSQIVLNHMGIPDVQRLCAPQPSEADRHYISNWQNAISKLAQCNNVVCKISGLNPNKPYTFEQLFPCIEFVFQHFGEDRIMFASNYPVCNLNMNVESWVECLMQLTQQQTALFRHKLFYSNAQRVYRLT